jgi:hypothetical protein
LCLNQIIVALILFHINPSLRFYPMIAIVLHWHRATSWKLGRSHGKQGRPYNRPWWVDEAHYALAYTHAKLIEIRPAAEASLTMIDQEVKSAL